MPDTRSIRARIFSLVRGSLHDGPGLRTVLFLKGCPLKCIWCHNPESQSFETSKGASLAECEKNVSDISVQQAVEYCLEDACFYTATNGGVTFSGGEPLYQPVFIAEVAKQLHQRGIHTALDTCGDVPKESIEVVMNHIDLWLYDIKILDGDEYEKKTFGNLSRVLDNLNFIDEASSVQIILRCPIIPGINDSEKHFRALGKIANSLTHVSGMTILPYHNYGIHKYQQLGKSYRFDLLPSCSVDSNQALRWQERIQSFTEVPVRLHSA